jgi:hypothetical protein
MVNYIIKIFLIKNKIKVDFYKKTNCISFFADLYMILFYFERMLNKYLKKINNKF